MYRPSISQVLGAESIRFGDDDDAPTPPAPEDPESDPTPRPWPTDPDKDDESTPRPWPTDPDKDDAVFIHYSGHGTTYKKPEALRRLDPEENDNPRGEAIEPTDQITDWWTSTITVNLKRIPQGDEA